MAKSIRPELLRAAMTRTESRTTGQTVRCRSVCAVQSGADGGRYKCSLRQRQREQCIGEHIPILKNNSCRLSVPVRKEIVKETISWVNLWVKLAWIWTGLNLNFWSSLIWRVSHLKYHWSETYEKQILTTRQIPTQNS